MTTTTFEYFIANYGNDTLWIMGAFTLVAIFFLVYNFSKEFIHWLKNL